MTESNMTRPAMLLQRNTKFARRHSGPNKNPRRKSALLLDTQLSSSPLLANSTRHSVTSRIEPNSRLLSHLIFSTRHLNATLENRNFVEKFNTRLRFFAASRCRFTALLRLTSRRLRPAAFSLRLRPVQQQYCRPQHDDRREPHKLQHAPDQRVI